MTTEQIYQEIFACQRPFLFFEVPESSDWLLKEPTLAPAPCRPSDWFSFKFRQQANKYGPPILERRFSTADGIEFSTPLQINEDFFAAILGHESCGNTIYYKPEQRWYRMNQEGEYYPADEEDLKLTLSQQLIKCSQNMNGYVDIEILLSHFRSDEVLNRVIRRGKAVLGKDKTFFSHESGNRRSAVVTIEDAARRFVDECLKEENDSFITVQECLARYTEYSQANEYPQIPRNGFTQVMNTAIMRRFNRSLRNDLIRLGADQARGWKGVNWKDHAV
jgi:hypothetical protein